MLSRAWLHLASSWDHQNIIHKRTIGKFDYQNLKHFGFEKDLVEFEKTDQRVGENIYAAHMKQN